MPDPLATVVGVRFRNAGKILYFHAAGMRLETGEYVVVETPRGPEIARVVIAPDQVVVNEMGREELKPILRLATDHDIRRADELKQRAENLLPEARQLADEMHFAARIDNAEFTLDGRRVTLSFTSEERLDYRDFVRRASERLGARVDMKQLGSRDRAKLIGGYGICGRELCCSSWLTTFPSISIRMAKEQDLPLNPQKISGLCGRLLCCLSYEEEGYKEMRKTLPKIGQRCSTPTGEGKVIALDILKREVTLLVEGQRIVVGDRDLGLVVRWDTASKSGEPPASISRADAIAQGLIEATDEDIAAAEQLANGRDSLPNEVSVELGPGRGRLPGGGPRKEIRNRPRRPSAPASNGPNTGPATGARGTRPGTGRGQRSEQPPPRVDTTQNASRGKPDSVRGGRPATPPERRIFQRAVPADAVAPKADAEFPGSKSPEVPDAGTPNSGRPRGGRRGRRGRGGRGNTAT